MKSAAVSLDTLEVALRAVQYFIPSTRSWAAMPDEDSARATLRQLESAHREIIEALKTGELNGHG